MHHRPDLTLSGLLQGRASGHPDRELLTWGDGGRATYGEVARAVREQAEALGDAGLAGRRVGLISRNRPETLVLWLGCMDAGCAPVFLNPESTPEEVGTIVDDLAVDALFADPELADLATIVRPLPETPGIEPVGADKGARPGDSPHTPDLGAIVLTSGSTGRPKYVAVPHAAYVLKGVLNALYLGWEGSDVAYGVMPFFHVGAQCETLAPAIASGARVDVVERFSAGRLWEDVERLGTTHLHATGSILAMGLAAGANPGLDSVRRIVASFRPDLVERLRGELPAAELVALYGLSECPLGTLGRPGQEYRPGWVGTPYAGPASIRVAGPGGEALDAGDEGEVQFRNEACAIGYLGPDPPEAFTADGWLHTGDLGCLADGGLYLTGRIKEMIRRSGENISPAQVEDAALSHPDVVEAAAIPHPDPVRDEEVRLVVEVASRPGGPDPGELREHIARSLARYKLPRYIDVLDSIPKTASGKVDKPQIPTMHPQPRWDVESQGGPGG